MCGVAGEQVEEPSHEHTEVACLRVPGSHISGTEAGDGEAEAALKSLARQLDKVNPDAGASCREGLAETLTVTRLGVNGSLLKTVMSTNPVESMIEIVRANAHNVKRWKDGDMRLRWAATGMLAAEQQFRRVKGYRQLPALATALKHAVTGDTPSTLAVTA